MPSILRQPAAWLVAAIIVVLIVVTVTSRRPEPRVSSGTVVGAASDPQSPECAYAAKLETTIAEFVGSASRAANGSVGGTESDVDRAFGLFDRDAARMIADLQAYAVPRELAGLNADFVRLFEEMTGEAAGLRAASLSRDPGRVMAAQGTFSQTLVTKAAVVQSQNDAATQRLARCRT